MQAAVVAAPLEAKETPPSVIKASAAVAAPPIAVLQLPKETTVLAGVLSVLKEGVVRPSDDKPAKTGRAGSVLVVHLLTRQVLQHPTRPRQAQGKKEPRCVRAPSAPAPQTRDGLLPRKPLHRPRGLQTGQVVEPSRQMEQIGRAKRQALMPRPARLLPLSTRPSYDPVGALTRPRRRPQQLQRRPRTPGVAGVRPRSSSRPPKARTTPKPAEVFRPPPAKALP